MCTKLPPNHSLDLFFKTDVSQNVSVSSDVHEHTACQIVLFTVSMKIILSRLSEKLTVVIVMTHMWGSGGFMYSFPSFMCLSMNFL